MVDGPVVYRSGYTCNRSNRCARRNVVRHGSRAARDCHGDAESGDDAKSDSPLGGGAARLLGEEEGSTVLCRHLQTVKVASLKYGVRTGLDRTLGTQW